MKNPIPKNRDRVFERVEKMPYRINPSYKDCYYHVYNRGNNLENIFFEKRNYDFFIRKLIESFADKIELVYYCLMPNHYHLIVHVKENSALEKAMQKFSISYAKAINKSCGRVGYLFQGRYKNKFIPDNNYLLHLSRYIHLNPVKAGLAGQPEEYAYSSYLDYLGNRKSKFLHFEIITEQIKNYKEFVMSFQEEQNYYLKDLLFE